MSKSELLHRDSASENSLFEDYLIVTTVNSNYLKIFDIWYYYFSSTKYKSMLRVITLDKISEHYISKKSIETIYIGKSTNDFSKIIIWRFEIIYKLLKQGKNIIQTDCDAFWINVNLSDIIKENYDIQVSIAYGIPVKAIAKWGFTLCMGFVILKSNQSTINFTNKWIKSCAKTKDDQISFNNILLNDGIQWELKDTTKNSGFCKKNNLKVEAINYNVISREVKSNLKIFHPYLPSNNQNLKIIDLIKRLKVIDENQYLDDYLKATILSPKGWVISTFGWTAVIYHKFKKKIKEKFLKY